jgi:crotonobetainyl-CoA:carnitine CoA-transferase CaiB-like acyl-CoA transferase
MEEQMPEAASDHSSASAKEPENAPRPGPLSGIVVLDLTHVLAGPFTGMTLADLGATVIKIEKPGRGDQTRGTAPYYKDMSHYFAAMNRNKLGLALDLKSEDGRAVFKDLLARADVLLHNFRPGVMDSLGFGQEMARALNPRLIYCEISGFGQYGPLRDRPAYDNVVQAMAGLMSLTGEPDGRPLRSGSPIADYVGGFNAIIAILTALFDRTRTGLGQHLDVAMFDSLVGVLSSQIPFAQITGRSPDRSGAIHPSIVPMGSFRTRDSYMVIAAFNQAFWKKLCAAVGRTDWLDDERYATGPARARNRQMLLDELEPVLAGKTNAQWSAIFEEADVPYGPVTTVTELLDHPNVKARELLEPLGIGPLRSPIRPVKYSAFKPSVRKPPPRLGEDTAFVLEHILERNQEEVRRYLDTVEQAERLAKDKAARRSL